MLSLILNSAKRTLCVCAAAFSTISCASPQSNTQPNILWLTFEDTSAYELSIYGNKTVQQPSIEALANEGLVFTNASSNGPHCSPARTSLISGHYATHFGADHHRAIVLPPADRLYYPEILKQAGYFTTNNSKQDYNVKLSKEKLAKLWSEWDKKASYNSPNRKPNQPFFAVFNAGMTHMSRLTSFTTENRRDFSESAGVDKSARPSYLPNLPEVVSDYQFHLEGVVDIDHWVKIFVDDLKAKGLYEDTIIFVYSDHGGSAPTGKGYLSQSRSLQVPLVIRVPDKFKHLVPDSLPNELDKMVSFIDFGPTVLSLAGVKTPDEMEGLAFLGKHAAHDRSLNFGFRTNQEKHYDPLRSVTDGEYSYTKAYFKRKPIMLRNEFQWGMPSNIALDEFAKTQAGSEFAKSHYHLKQGEFLYDLKSDFFEENDLSQSNNTAHQTKLKQLREAVSLHIRENRDLGFVPLVFKKDIPYAQWLPADFDYDAFYDLVELVANVDKSDIPKLTLLLNHKHELIRFWAVQGFAELAAFKQITQLPNELIALSKNDASTISAAIASVAREAMIYTDNVDALKALVKMDRNEHQISSMQTLAYLKPEFMRQHISIIRTLETEVDLKIIESALGFMSATEIASDKQFTKGLKINLDRRALKPKP